MAKLRLTSNTPGHLIPGRFIPWIRCITTKHGAERVGANLRSKRSPEQIELTFNMAEPLFPQWSKLTRPVIGMVHLKPLPGSPRFEGDWQAVIDAALKDAQALIDGGVHGLMVENFGDAPFYPDQVPQHTIAHMTTITTRIRALNPELPIGVNVLRNDAQAALAVAHAAQAQFIRVNVLSGARLTDQGIVQGKAAELLRQRKAWCSDTIRILADLRVKHSAELAPVDLQQEVHDLIHRAGADALIITGSGTGNATPIELIQQVQQHSGETPVMVGSGINADNITRYRREVDAFIVGSSLKVDGRVENAVEPHRVERLMRGL